MSCIKCGDEKEHYAKGLCRTCYLCHRQGKVVICSDCQKSKRHHAKGLCKPCYMRRWYQTYPVEGMAHTLHRHKGCYQHEQGANHKRHALNEARRRARLRALPDTLTPSQAEHLLRIGQATYPGEELHLDHIVPLSKGGGTTYANVHAIPASINLSKSDKLPDEIYEQHPLIL